MTIDFILNGEALSLEVAEDRRVIDLLREDLGITGTKEGCGSGECGACTILVDGQPKLSCLMLVAQLQGRQITTIEGLSTEGTLHPVQTAFISKGAVQCGFCTPGMVLTAAEFLTRDPHPSRERAAEAISGNICRCTGYQKILDAISSVEADHRMVLPQDVQSGTHILSSLSSLAHEEKRPVFMPGTFDALWQLLSKFPKARVLAGGTDVLVWIRSGRISPEALISLESIENLKGISETEKTIRIGACTTHSQLIENKRIEELFPVLISAVRTLGSPHIRRMGTLGGNIMTASPAGDTLPPLYVLGARVELQSQQTVRELPIGAFIRGPGQTAINSGEILSTVILPKPERMISQRFEKVGLRSAMACAVASLAGMISMTEEGKVETAAFAWGSVGPTVIRVPELEAALIGKPFTRHTIEALIPMLQSAISPIDDIRAGAGYRRLVAENLLRRWVALPVSLPTGSNKRPFERGAVEK